MYQSELEIIGERIQILREKKRWTQEILAEKINVSRNTLTKLEGGFRDFKSTELLNIAKALEVSTDYLLGLTDVSRSDVTVREISKRYGLTEGTLDSLCSITALTAMDKYPGIIETPSGVISASAVLSAVNAILTDEKGLEMLEKFDYVVSETNTSNVAELTTTTSDRNLKKQQDYAEFLQFKAWKAFNSAIESISRLNTEV